MSNREEFEKVYTDAFIGEDLKGLESIIFARFEIGGEYAQDKVATAYAMWQARVPEGYVVVPVNTLKRTVGHISTAMCHPMNTKEEEGIMQIDMDIIEKSMIEAVEK